MSDSDFVSKTIKVSPNLLNTDIEISRNESGTFLRVVDIDELKKISKPSIAPDMAIKISRLKKCWLEDSCWDLEDTEGFEDHRQELLDFRLGWEKIWAKKRMAKKLEEMVATRKREISFFEELIALIEVANDQKYRI